MSHKDVLLSDTYDAADISPGSFIHILCHQGRGQFELDGVRCAMSKNDLVIALPNSHLTDLLLSPDFKGMFLTVSGELMSRNNPDLGWGIKGFMFAKTNPVISLTDEECKRCEQGFFMLASRYNEQGHKFREEVLNLQLRIFIMDMWYLLHQKFESRLASGRKAPLFEQFLMLVEQHCMEYREVQFYSEQLHITPKYLSEVCKKSSGKTASDWIGTFTKQRIIILLDDPGLTLSQVADILHFSSQTFFSRYVKKVLGVTPSEYRQRLN